jgi:hypothetical protein
LFDAAALKAGALGSTDPECFCYQRRISIAAPKSLGEIQSSLMKIDADLCLLIVRLALWILSDLCLLLALPNQGQKIEVARFTVE